MEEPPDERSEDSHLGPADKTTVRKQAHAFSPEPPTFTLVGLDERIERDEGDFKVRYTGSLIEGIDVVNGSLCYACSALFNGKAERSRGYGDFVYNHHPTMDALRSAVWRGCPLCKSSIERFDTMPPEGNHPAENLNMIAYFHHVITPMEWRLFWMYETAKPGGANITMRFFATSHYINHQSIPSTHDTSDNTGSDSSWKLAKAWLETCDASHICKPRKKKWHPTRLLDVSGLEIRLIITQEVEPSDPYMTLSHCWGKVKFLTLTSENLVRLKAGFQMSILPKTFQHAIEATRHLGLKYLWIDSLCIIQGRDAEARLDWQSESAMMEEVYSQSYCNISATGGSNGDDGCFFDRNETDVPGKFQVEVPPGVREFDGELFSGYLFVDRGPEVWRQNMERSPLLARAWVAQERLLAPRVLHFCKKQLVWECQQLVACETHAGGSTAMGQDSPKAAFAKLVRDLESPVVLPEKEVFTLFLEWWAKQQSSYTSMALTEPKDRLPAMSGIAKRFAKVTRWKYHAGLRSERFECQLLWSVDFQGDECGRFYRPTPTRAPTWSWMSIEAQSSQQALFEEYNSVIAVSKISLTLKNNKDPFGEVLRGRLDLIGQLTPLDLSVLHQLGEDCVEAPKLWSSLEFCYLEWQNYERMTVFLDEPITSHISKNIYYLPIIFEKRWAVYGLLIASTQANGVFTRIGMFKAYETDERFLFRKQRCSSLHQKSNVSPPDTIHGKCQVPFDKPDNYEDEFEREEIPPPQVIDGKLYIYFDEPTNYEDESEWEDIPKQRITII